MNTDIDKGMFLAEPLKTPRYFLRRLFLSILRTKMWKKPTGYSRNLLAQHITNSTLRILTAQGKPGRCLLVPYGDKSGVGLAQVQDG